jgi:hypothetical protein
MKKFSFVKIIFWILIFQKHFHEIKTRCRNYSNCYSKVENFWPLEDVVQIAKMEWVDLVAAIADNVTQVSIYQLKRA